MSRAMIGLPAADRCLSFSFLAVQRWIGKMCELGSSVWRNTGGRRPSGRCTRPQATVGRLHVLPLLIQRSCVVLLPIFVVLCFGLPRACSAREPIRIGVSLGLTGQFRAMSEALHKGFTLWQQHVNAQGGILGRSVEILCEDDQSDPKRAQAIYQQFVARDKVDFLFAPYSSLLTMAVLPIAENNGIPMLIAGAAADSLWEQGFHNAIGVYTPASKFTVGFLELLVLHELDGIGVVYADDPFSVDLANSTKKWAQWFGLRVDLFERFAKGTGNLRPLARKAREKGCQVLMICGHMNEAVNMTRTLKRMGWQPKAYYASVGPALQAFHDQCGEDAERVFATSLWEPRANYPGAMKFEHRFNSAYGEIPGYHAGLAYAAGQVLEEAIKEAGSVDRDKVRSMLFKLDTMTIIGRYGVDSTGKQMRQHAFIIQWQGGKKELVWPEEIMSSEPQF